MRDGKERTPSPGTACTCQRFEEGQHSHHESLTSFEAFFSRTCTTPCVSSNRTKTAALLARTQQTLWKYTHITNSVQRKEVRERASKPSKPTQKRQQNEAFEWKYAHRLRGLHDRRLRAHGVKFEARANRVEGGLKHREGVAGLLCPQHAHNACSHHGGLLFFAKRCGC